jgi:hypothetical protein
MVPRRPLGRAGIELFAISFVVLFQELTLIRWLPGQVRVLAYFPNLILLGAFLGLGVGCLRAGKRSLLWLWPVSMLVLGTTGWLLSRVAFTQNSPTEHLWLLYYDLGEKAPIVSEVRLPIVLFFILAAVSFVALGQMVAERLQEFRVASSALWGYTCDLGGSLVGVILFGLCGMARTTPVIWFAGFLVVGTVFFAARWRSFLAYAATVAILLGLVQHADRASFYSPYYAINLADGFPSSLKEKASTEGFSVLTNGSVHQVAYNLQRSGGSEHDTVLTGYHFPYRCLQSQPRNVLVLGAGTGNDVAVALDEGAERVDAVEIDPVILALGSRHPNHPYASPRVRTINADARTFLNETTERYDLIVFGTLDSMTRLSALSNVRLDNFVYTSECIEAAKARLTPRGGIVMYFMVSLAHIDRRLAGMLNATFGRPPLIGAKDHLVFNRIYLSGPAFDYLQPPERSAASPAMAARLSNTELPSDDWPYLYMQGREISGFYLLLIGVFSAIALLSVSLASGDMRRSMARGGLDWEMFLFGFAFLLLETKSVTTMSLLWGATWLTSAVVFGAILAMVLAATVLVQLRPLPWALCMGGLIVSLVAAYFVPVHALLRMNDFLRLLLSIAFVGTPIFFAAACFALLFRDRPEANTAFGWNLLGAVAGGLVEFVSMITGIRALYLLVLMAYLGVMLLRIRAAEQPQPPGPVAAA